MYLTSYGWVQGNVGLNRETTIYCPQPQLARYLMPPLQKLRMLNNIGKNKEKEILSHKRKFSQLFVLVQAMENGDQTMPR